jgi:hypothetical protein
MKPRMCSVWAWKYIYIYISISSNHKCCIEGGLINFNYKRNLAFRIILAFFPSLVANVLWHNHPVEPGVEGRKVTSHSPYQYLHLGVIKLWEDCVCPKGDFEKWHKLDCFMWKCVKHVVGKLAIYPNECSAHLYWAMAWRCFE